MWLDDLRRKVETRVGKGATLVVAVSGGGDSVGLLRALHSCAVALNLRLVVAHLDHALRAESGADAAFVGRLSLELGWMCVRERLDVAGIAAKEGRNLEDAARSLRYAFLETTARAVGGSYIVTAHTQDDQAETVLMHLLRGAGLEGMAGMAEVGRLPIGDSTTPLFRPLLGVARETLRAWLSDNGYGWSEDSTNADTGRFRSKVRHSLLPFLEGAAPRLRERLARSAATFAADADLLQTLTAAAWHCTATELNGQVRFDREAFRAEPHAIQRRLIRRAYGVTNSSRNELSAVQITGAVELALHGRVGQEMTLPGDLTLITAHDGVWLGAPAAPVTWEATEVLQNGTAEAAGKAFTAEVVELSIPPHAWQNAPPTIAYFDHNQLKLPLNVRPPRPEDRWQPFGMDGRSVLLRTWLAKQKLPRHERDSVPLLVDSNGTIVWVVGCRTAHAARVTADTTRILRIQVTN